MNRTLVIVALFVGILFCAIGYSDSRYKTAVGRMAPPLSIDAAERSIALDKLRGEYVLLVFWSSSDAPSRRAANVYSSWVREHPDAGVVLVSVNFDTSEGLFNEIVRRDGLIGRAQYYVEGVEAEKIRVDYGLGNGYGSVLINPLGRIVAHNPGAEGLDARFG